MVRAEVQWGEPTKLKWAASEPQGSKEEEMKKQDQKKGPCLAASGPEPSDTMPAKQKTLRSTGRDTKDRLLKGGQK